eukprot:CAMPEP_0204205088 /NCGR_PEP_ID=MMETSP0361-20130328/70092_1 /ASSEMBLY_ACC=CAM_ASM_000343 /TAXON_ID=268821 /ORGANISM="Scrippsiella Hangoei, Strain SHTV-5" /LENGTH=187 /DNA_ID=CAMNT_0051168301 /DNA_START=33 /DNA_END=593 /DNA_ORIENTATION=+
MSEIRHDQDARLVVLLCETLKLAKGPLSGGERGLVCHWYASLASGDKSDHVASETFVPPRSAGAAAAKLNFCAFLVVDASSEAKLNLTVSSLDGQHLGVYSGTLRQLTVSDQFEIKELTLEAAGADAGPVAKVVVHAAKQGRWNYESAPRHELGCCRFVGALGDSQAGHIWKFLFKDLPPTEARRGG